MPQRAPNAQLTWELLQRAPRLPSWRNSNSSASRSVGARSRSLPGYYERPVSNAINRHAGLLDGDWPEGEAFIAPLSYIPTEQPVPFLDRRDAGPKDMGEFIEIGDPNHPRLRREYEKKYGVGWPRDPVTGRQYDVAHIKALADGGTNTVDNIRPMHPDKHRVEHKANGDPGRWGKRAGIARAFGGTVERGPRGPTIKGLGLLSIIPNITGILSGRIRTDKPENFVYDLLGYPTPEDQRKMIEEQQRLHNPKWKWGDPEMI